MAVVSKLGRSGADLQRAGANRWYDGAAMKLDLPTPRDWQSFEDLCRDLWAELWGDPNAQKHGRTGQKQRGVDIFGQPGSGADWEGVQCKR